MTPGDLHCQISLSWLPRVRPPSLCMSDHSHSHKGQLLYQTSSALTSSADLHLCTKEDFLVRLVLKLVCRRGLVARQRSCSWSFGPSDVLVQAKPSSHSLGSRLVGDEKTSCLARKLESVVKIPAPLTAVSTQSISLARGMIS